MYKITITKYATVLSTEKVNRIPTEITCPDCGTTKKIGSKELKNEGYICKGYPQGVRKKDYNWCIVSVSFEKME